MREAVPGLEATLKFTFLPETVGTIQLSLVVAVKAQPMGEVTPTVPAPPLGEYEDDVGEMAVTHPVPSCVIVRVCPAIVTVPVRLVVLVFCETVKLTVPLPEPVAPEVMVIQVSLDVAVQLQPAVVVTAALPLPPV